MALILKGRAKLKGSTVIGKRPYAIDGVFNPELVLDFQKNYYRTNSVAKTFPNAITHTRASTATYVDSTGTLQTAAINEPRLGHHVYNGTAWVNEGLLHESEARTNLILYSEEFDNAAWLRVFTSVIVNTTLAPDGTTNADKLVEDTTAATPHYIRVQSQSITSGVTYSASVFVKAAERSRVRLVTFNGSSTATSLFDLSSGTLVSGPDSAFISPAGDGWFRVGASFTAAASTTSNFVYQLHLDDGTTNVYTGDGTSGIFIFGAQLEAAPTVSSYIPTAGPTVTRSADVLTIPAANLPYPEPVVIGPELVTNGTFDSDVSGWSSDNGIVTWNASGYVDIDRNSGSYGNHIYQNISTASGKVYLLSYDIVALSNQVDLRVGNVTVQSVTTTGTKSYVFVASGATTDIEFDAAASVTATLSLDNISVREINPLALSIQMDGRVTYADTGDAVEARLYNWRLDASNLISPRISTLSAATGTVIFDQLSLGVADNVSSEVLTPDVLAPYNIASRHGSTFVNGAVDGTALTANTTPTSLPDLSATDLTLGQDYNGTIRTFRMWAQDIGDTGLVEATEPSLVPSLSLTFDGTENSFIVNDWSE